MIKVSVVGAKGRMGSHVVEAVNNAEDTQLALALDALNFYNYLHLFRN